MSNAPTPEQSAIIDAYRAGGNLVVQAGAGTGKTSTLKMAARAKLATGVYVAYNRSIATEAARSFPASVLCKTSHGLAMAAIGRRFGHRLNSPRMPAKDVARLLRINEPARLSGDLAPLSPQQLARIAMATVERFCHSGDVEISSKHVPGYAGLEALPVRNALTRVAVPLAQRAWLGDLTRTDGKLRFGHDHYLKMWSLTNPQLDADVVFLDEAQDSNPAVVSVVMGQKSSQLVLVGDSCQAIYGWRGAVDAMARFDGQQFQLSKSFRFGQAVADQANLWLSLLGAPLRLTGYERINSVVGPVDAPDAILCRSSARAIGYALAAMESGRRAALVGGGKDIKALAEAAIDLKAGRGTSHPELLAFSTWPEVQDYVEQDSSGSDLKVFVGLIDGLGPDAVLRIVASLVDEDQADVVLSTAHKAKGREWASVKIADDFREPRAIPGERVAVPREDAMLAYVAVTRAQQRLDREGLAWIDRMPGVRPGTSELIEASTLGDPIVAGARRDLAAAAQRSLTGMPEEQGDWDGVPAAAPGADRWADELDRALSEDEEPARPCPRCGGGGATRCTCDPATLRRWMILTGRV